MASVKNARNVAVVVPLPLGGEAVVDGGGVLETSDEHAASLLEQPDNWQPAARAEKKEKD